MASDSEIKEIWDTPSESEAILLRFQERIELLLERLERAIVTIEEIMGEEDDEDQSDSSYEPLYDDDPMVAVPSPNDDDDDEELEESFVEK